MDRKLSPLKIVILYAVFGLSWILFSDLLLSTITKDPEIYTKISIVKGWLYVALTAVLLYWLVSLYSKQRTQSEVALRENEQRFRAFFEAHGSVMMLIDPDTGGIVDANGAAADYYGFTRDTLRSMAISDINMLPLEELATQCRHAASTQYNFFVVPHRLAGGEIRTVEVHTSPIEVAQKKLLFSIIHDITERKRAEEEVMMLKHSIDVNFDGAYWMDKENKFVYVNDAGCKALGYTREELIGKAVNEVNPAASAERMRDIWASLRDGRSFFDESVHRRKDGSEFPVEIASTYIRFGGREYVCGFARDITERKRAEMELEKYRDHLEELVAQRTKEISVLNDQLRQSQKLEAVGILAGGIAHEFSNILATMKGSLYLIQKRLPEGSPTMKYAEQILDSMNKANTLSQGLLTFSRKQKMFLKPVHFNQIIRSVGKMLIQLIGEDIELTMTLTGKNPTVMADMNQIEQVLVNLATNARDAMPDGGILTIGTDVMKIDDDFKKQHGYGAPGEYVVLTISDSGTGMEEAIRGKIFEPFFTTKVLGKGSGLGLAVTYGIVKQHNGFIDVESVPGEGTTFKIFFPIVEAKVIQPIGQDRPQTMGGVETVLLAEDDEDARTIMSEMLRMSGYTVLEAGDGEEAIRVYKGNKDRVQLVFLDVRMPKKNGRVAYEEIKRIRPQTKFLFMSGYTADIMDSLGVSEGGINFISKAASPDETLRKIREVLDR